MDERWTDKMPVVTVGFVTLAIVASIVVWTSGSVSAVCYGGLTTPLSQWLYRFVLSELAHMNVLHLLLNAVALGQLGAALERKMKRRAYAALLLFCVICTNALCTLYFLVASHSCVVGASGVFFALLSFWCYGLEDPRVNFCGFPLHAAVMPWASAALVQVIFWNAAWYGHVAGILSGAIAFFCVPPRLWDALGCSDAPRSGTAPDGNDDDGAGALGDGLPQDTVAVTVSTATGTKTFEGKGHRLGGP